tara:strand:+ start:335 stop:574 length:240 start_codon:yes stop_codon:yes gene_type:complete
MSLVDQQKAEYFLYNSLAALEKDIKSHFTPGTYKRFFKPHLDAVRHEIDESFKVSDACHAVDEFMASRKKKETRDGEDE